MFNDERPKILSKKHFMDAMGRKNERRKHERLPCDRFMTGSLFLPRSGKTLEVLVHDLSIQGVGAMARNDIEIDQEVIVNLKRTNAISMIPLPAQVSYCITENEYYFRIGCKFEDRMDFILWEYLVGW